jgi:phage baseplate assembly protein gpV
VTVNPAGITINCGVTVNGSVNASDDVTAVGISLHNQTHGGVKGGGENAGAPP